MKKIFLVLMLVCSFDFALALGGYAGVGLGYSQINNDNVSSSIDGGSFSGVTKIGFSFSKNFSLGLALTSWVGSASSLGVDTTTVIYPLAVEGNWHIIQDSNGPYIGLAAATVLDVTIVDSGGTNSTNTSSNSGLGGQLGWNFAIGSKEVHSIGLEMRYLKVSDSPKFDMFGGYVFYSFWFGNRK